MNAVEQVFLRQGHAVDRVRSDYGEDLLVQISDAGQMDSARLWVQVKGTMRIARYRYAEGGFRMSFPLPHLVRWIRSADQVLVVIWDVTEGKGWYAWPSTVDQHGTVGQATATLRFLPEHRFTDDTVDVVVWDARIEHYNGLYLRADAIDRDPSSEDHQPLSGIIGIAFLVLVDIFEERKGMYRLTEKARHFFVLRMVEIITNDRANNTGGTAPEDIDATLGAAAMVTILKFTADKAKTGLPQDLLMCCIYILVRVMGDQMGGREAAIALLEP